MREEKNFCKGWIWCLERSLKSHEHIPTPFDCCQSHGCFEKKCFCFWLKANWSMNSSDNVSYELVSSSFMPLWHKSDIDCGKRIIQNCCRHTTMAKPSKGSLAKRLHEYSEVATVHGVSYVFSRLLLLFHKRAFDSFINSHGVYSFLTL